jgi:hypothetical protein
MMSLEVQTAVRTLQQRAVSAHDVFDLDRIDRALDELTRNPHKTAEPQHQVRGALSNAGKVLVRRKKRLPLGSSDDPDLHESVRERAFAFIEGGFDAADLRQWLDTTPSLSTRERWILQALADGADAEMLSALLNLPLARVRERISRARRVASAAYNREVRCA